jgi:hypothetical protein
MANIILPIEVILTSDEATALAPSGKLACVICPVCSAIIPIYRIMDHTHKIHLNTGEDDHN